MRLIIGNKNYSSWSFRPWIAMKVAGIAFAARLWPAGAAARAHARAIAAEMHAGFAPLRRHLRGSQIFRSHALLRMEAEVVRHVPVEGVVPDRQAISHRIDHPQQVFGAVEKRGQHRARLRDGALRVDLGRDVACRREHAMTAGDLDARDGDRRPERAAVSRGR